MLFSDSSINIRNLWMFLKFQLQSCHFDGRNTNVNPHLIFFRMNKNYGKMGGK